MGERGRGRGIGLTKKKSAIWLNERSSQVSYTRKVKISKASTNVLAKVVYMNDYQLSSSD
jgi:hypothetical protein